MPARRTRTRMEDKEGKERVVINVSGKVFHTTNATLRSGRYSNLHLLTKYHQNYDRKNNEFRFDRNPKVFAAILNMHRTHELHLPQDVCGPTLREELEFWHVDDARLKACCTQKYREFTEQQKAMVVIERYFGTFDVLEELELDGKLDNLTKFQALRLGLYRFLDDPISSTAATFWSIFFMFSLVASCILLVLSTVPYFRVPTVLSGGPVNNTTAGTLVQSLLYSKPIIYVAMMENVFVFFYLAEWLIRFLLSFNHKAFISNVFNCIDLCSVIVMLARFTLRQLTLEQWWLHEELFWAHTMLMLGETFRLVRLVKLGQRYIGLKVLVLSLLASFKELFLLFFLIFMVSLVFAVCIYLSEVMIKNSYEDMTQGAWWALITTTTVGYGDFTPHTLQGRLIGIVCALSGIIATGLPIPIIANNFDLYYTYAQMMRQGKEHKRQKIKQAGVRDAVKRAVNRTRRALMRQSQSGLSAMTGMVFFTRQSKVTETVEEQLVRRRGGFTTTRSTPRSSPSNSVHTQTSQL